jgi:protein ImuB
MMRIVSVWLPQWPLERMERAAPGSVPAEDAFVLVASGTTGLRISAVNGPACAAGLYPGQALADARAAVPSLLTRPAEARQDRAALLALAHWCGRYGPNQNIDGDDGLWIDITGVGHLFGSEAALASDLVGRLRAFGITARVGRADTLGAAFALARYGSPLPAEKGEEGISSVQTLATLPVEALRLDDESVFLLKRLGLRRIGQLYGIRRAALARRFRAARARAGDLSGRTDRVVPVLTRLDQALGHASEPLEPLVEPPAYCVRRVFADPLISAEGIAYETEALAAELCRELEAAAQGVRNVRLCLYRADGTWAEARAGTSSPCRAPQHVVSLLGEKLATLDAGFGIDMITLEATRVEPLGRDQQSLSDLAHNARADPATLIDRLSNRLGAERVTRLVACESYLPERAQRVVPALESAAKRAAVRRRSGTPANMSGKDPGQPRAARLPRGERGEVKLAARPVLLLRRPEPISVLAEVPEGPPARFIWRRLTHRIVKAEGPERIAPEWWREIGASGPSRARDYYRIEDESGGRYWVFREGLFGGEAEHGSPTWFLHGVFG